MFNASFQVAHDLRFSKWVHSVKDLLEGLKLLTYEALEQCIKRTGLLDYYSVCLFLSAASNKSAAMQ